MMIILIIVIAVLLFLLLRRNNTARRPYDEYPRPEPPYQSGYGGGMGGGMGGGLGDGMGRGVGMFAGGLAAGALLSYLWEQGRISEDQFHHFSSLGNDEAIRQLQEQNLIQDEEIDDLRSRLGADDSQIQADEPFHDENDDFDDNGAGDTYDNGGDDYL